MVKLAHATRIDGRFSDPSLLHVIYRIFCSIPQCFDLPGNV